MIRWELDAPGDGLPFTLKISHHFARMLLLEQKRELDPGQELERTVGPGLEDLVEIKKEGAR